MMEIERCYKKMHKSGELDKRKIILNQMLSSCELCPRKCRVNRLNNELGYCHGGRELVVSSVFPHFQEEAELVGQNGSGAVFFTNCNLRCLYCQNSEISCSGQGEVITKEHLAQELLSLQALGCHNINLITPTHFVPQIIEALQFAIDQGLNLPLVYNCGGYESVEVIKLLDGIIDIYMPDIKYSDAEAAKTYSKAEDYFERAKEAVLEMYRQVGDLEVKEGIAQRGLLVRHLVLPNHASGSRKVLEFIAREVSRNTFVNIMGQYWPYFRAKGFSEIGRPITEDEFKEVLQMAADLGLGRASSH